MGKRSFRVGQYVTTSDGLTGFIYDDDGGPEDGRPYEIAICERDEERFASASELTLWVGSKVMSEPAWLC